MVCGGAAYCWGATRRLSAGATDAPHGDGDFGGHLVPSR